MRRIALLFLGAALLFSFTACKGKETDIHEPVNFYYCREEVSYHSSDSVIFPVIREAASFGGNAETMLRTYLSDPVSKNGLLPVPVNTKLISFEIQADEVYLTFSESFSQLSGMDLTKAVSCIAMTVYDYTGIETLRVSVESGQLDGKDEIIINALDIILIDNLK